MRTRAATLWLAFGRTHSERSGSRRPGGMPAYEHLSDAELEALRHYIRQQAELARAAAR